MVKHSLYLPSKVPSIEATNEKTAKTPTSHILNYEYKILGEKTKILLSVSDSSLLN